MYLTRLKYRMELIASQNRKIPVICVEALEHANVPENYTQGEQRFHLDKEGMKRFHDWILQQWKNNLIKK